MDRNTARRIEDLERETRWLRERLGSLPSRVPKVSGGGGIAFYRRQNKAALDAVNPGNQPAHAYTNEEQNYWDWQITSELWIPRLLETGDWPDD